MLIDNTARIKKLAENYQLPPTPPGNQVIKFKRGQTVLASGTGTYKRNTPITITDAWITNGFAYYKDLANVIHRQQDLIS